LVKIKDLEITVKLPESSKQKIEVGKKYHFQILKIDKKGRKIDLDLEKEKKTKSKKKEE
jgi:ribosomal protein S1